jgi:multidrug efflux pump subunit AcrA (membrane-fusion protein)
MPGDELLEIVDTSRVWVFANLPVELVHQFKTGDRGVIVPKGREPIEAVLVYISPIADKTTLSVRLRFDVENFDGGLKPNEYVEVNLIEEAAIALTIPRSAVTIIDGVQGVFVQQEDGYVFVPTTVGRESDDWVEVLEGVSAGQQVVTKGVFDLKNAMLRESIQGE